MPGSGVVTGTVSFEAGSPDFAGATMYVRLEDTRVADAAAVVLSEVVLNGVTSPLPGGSVPFVMPTGSAEVGTQYNVRVHVDVDGDGAVSEGDFVTMRRYPVLVGGEVAATVRRV